MQFKNRPVETVDDLSGLGWTHPWSALGLSVCLLSLAGIPPLAGFWGKFQLFGSLLAAGERTGSSSFIVLAVIGMLSAAAGAYYYLRIVVVMYFGKPKDADRSDRRLADCRGRERLRVPDGLFRNQFGAVVEQGARRGASGAGPSSSRMGLRWRAVTSDCHCPALRFSPCPHDLRVLCRFGRAVFD